MASQKFREYVDDLTEDTAPDINADWVHTNDVSTGEPKKVLPRNLTKKIALTAAHGSDDTYEGITITGKNAGDTIAQWDPVYLYSDGKWYGAASDDGSSVPAGGIAVTAGTANNPLTVLKYGTVRHDDWNWTGIGDVAGALYLGINQFTQTAPSSSGHFVQRVGHAITADIAFFDFNSTVIEIA